jgi:Carboxypeptidase regulatory-like domain/PDZ domain
VTTDGDPVAAFTLLAFRRAGAARELVIARSFVTASGHFEIRAQPGSYDLIASASGWAPSLAVSATAPSSDVKLVVSPGATLSGLVTSSADHKPIPYARVMRESRGGGASAQPANGGTVTREDGTFELTGIPPGHLSITIGANQFHPRIEAAMTATDGGRLGPIAIALTPLADGETPTLELVGIGVKLSADGDALRVDMVIAGGGAAAAGIVVGDHVTAVDGAPVTELGVDGAVARIRGAPNTTVAITLARGDTLVTLTVERRKLHA